MHLSERNTLGSSSECLISFYGKLYAKYFWPGVAFRMAQMRRHWVKTAYHESREWSNARRSGDNLHAPIRSFEMKCTWLFSHCLSGSHKIDLALGHRDQNSEINVLQVLMPGQDLKVSYWFLEKCNHSQITIFLGSRANWPALMNWPDMTFGPKFSGTMRKECING